MNSRRLARLMRIICDIKAYPRRTPEEMCKRLDVSRRQFYKDRDTLAEMGFSFHYSRSGEGFVLDKELTFSAKGLSLTDLFSLILAVRELTRMNDFSLALGAINGLRNLVEELPGELRELFSEALDQLVVADGFSCIPEIMYTLQDAIKQGRRVAVEIKGANPSNSLTVDPKRLFLRDGTLFLEAGGLGSGKTGLLALSRIIKAVPTPFFSSPD
ncbi:helix-turn-helix transcriptional regulator [Dethiosulfatarculus sandiegensis]|uniref:WYL domain-containing protein n=1 Tax=Dethiosulfatarculus sandiegensis TaxID=1429043 RepID=A0A0D2JQN1_9BACT|nr:WYL domain-containing protein [Dethiosulfatarculus sandiegensis]KIX11815.1 hypothetical protein X474_22325 [Dethiosulfatarculus sandiegensis]